MKNSIIFVLALLVFTPLANAQSNQRDKYTIQVDGLGCPFCAYGLEKKFKEFKGIDDVKIAMETGIFTFSYPADNPLTVEQVEQQVELAGYTPMSTEIARADGSIETGKEGQVADSRTEASDLLRSEMFVAGNCEMCQARIEKAALKVNGATQVNWNVQTKMLTVTYDAASTSETAISEAIAAVGHDTEFTQAQDSKYEKLPACCLYRK
ncbi:heavy-metal-associated domain-containing protein [Tunicatimonas pelagia]|uniref:heavy-metal-associated domain-containing protein n=1 Tax=Tunicatimonas pelagia TaxID=931531 RepID=UPI0026653205|nr:heavy-metal-associated domain-containing protein [Tunicatimonas pelagia]WKN44803.1 heavy-metal-associated domain-containing protein [Tunicatimonas pelagia]